ncbi:YfjL-like protein [Sedimentibacter saalensis]|uniref:YfjL-like protein n=1 Tax=Sedimentibacter saalensis TaxID=130788 RepID=UPI0028995935|nr:hypothetical protein [Sedimentibacter saalensis]
MKWSGRTVPYDLLGGGTIKKSIKYKIVILISLLIMVFVFNFINSFTGNPVSAFIASGKIKDYAEANYNDMDLELSEVKYNFKNSAYGCHVQSRKSEDTNFYIGYSHGRVSDDYEYEVANHFTTYRRLSKDFNDMVTHIIEKEYPYETTLIIGDLLGDTQQLTPDAPLNLKDMPLQLLLNVSVLSDNQSDEHLAALLLELHQLLLSNDITIDEYTIRLEEPMPEEKKPGSGSNVYLLNFPSKNITGDKEALINAMRNHQLESNKNEKN